MINYANIIRRVLFLPVSENRRKDGDYVEDFRVPQEIILLSRALTKASYGCAEENVLIRFFF